MIAIFRKNRRSPAVKSRDAARLLNIIETHVAAGHLRRLGLSALALADYRKRGVPLQSDADSLRDEHEIVIPIPEDIRRQHSAARFRVEIPNGRKR